MFYRHNRIPFKRFTKTEIDSPYPLVIFFESAYLSLIQVIRRLTIVPLRDKQSFQETQLKKTIL